MNYVVSQAADVSSLMLWHSYVLYQLRQGIDPQDLAQRVGAIVPEVESVLRIYSLPGEPRQLDGIQFSYPPQAT